MDPNIPNNQGNNFYSPHNPNNPNNPNYQISSNSPNFQANLHFDPNGLANPNVQRMLYYNIPNRPIINLNQQFPNQFQQQFPNQFQQQFMNQIPQNFPSGLMFPMSQHVGNQVENSPTTPGGDGSSNKTPPERNANDDENDDDDVDGEDPQDSNTTSSNAKWGAQVDDALVSAWIECAIEDPETATNQRLAMMWKSIYDLYEQARKDNSSTIRRRTLRAMKGRWGRINKDVNLWVGCYAAAQRRNASGTNTYNVMTEAQEMYSASCNGARFTLISIWDVLKKSDKWRPTNKQVPNTSESDSSKRSEPDTPTEVGRRGRPDGVKKAKRKGKSVASSGISSLDSFTQALSEMNVMKEQYKSVDEKRADVAQQMLDYQKERDVEKKKRKEEEKRFKLFSVLLEKPNLSEDDQQLFQKLKEEFSHLLG